MGEKKLSINNTIAWRILAVFSLIYLLAVLFKITPSMVENISTVEEHNKIYFFLQLSIFLHAIVLGILYKSYTNDKAGGAGIAILAVILTWIFFSIGVYILTGILIYLSYKTTKKSVQKC